MEDLDWITIKECARIGQISVQAIYKKINSKTDGDVLQGHIKTIMGKKYLDKVAVGFILGNDLKDNEDPVIKEINSILNQLSEQDRGKVLNFAKQTLEVSRF